MAVDGLSLGMIAAGGLLAYAGVRGKSVPAALQALVQGKSPATAASAAQISGSTVTGSTGTTTGSIGPVPNPTTLQAYAFSLFGQFGWDSGQQKPLVLLWNQESGWNPNAQNPTSTAYGIAQFLDTTWGSYGPKTSDPHLQILYGLEYIRDRYGAPAMAWAHEQANNWY